MWGIVRKCANIALWIEISILGVLVALIFAGSAFGWQAFGVLSGSMEPTIETGALVFIDKNAEPASLQEGDVIAFEVAGDSGAVCTHRIVEVNDDQTFTTKGDNNDAVDANAVPYSKVLGKTADISIPVLGEIMLKITANPTVWIGGVLALTAGLVIITSIKPRRRENLSGEEVSETA